MIVLKALQSRPADWHPDAFEIWEAYHRRFSPEKRSALRLMCIALDQALRAYDEVLASGAVIPDSQHGTDS